MTLPRKCIRCRKPAIQGTSRCQDHGSTSVRKRNPAYDSHHQELAGRTIRQAQGVCANPDCRHQVGPSNPLQGDHIIPLSLGGRVEASNYQALCRKCNIAKGGRNRRHSDTG